ncbi:MAG: CDP-alcohol phosphatidyltransferase family protein [Betaproteobacteria bacterium]|jgi:phosphatidylglycerophosphate synthase|nr:CDP-alcohol phosphatidyltransferase family protein [Betaproteobacteria bacterium]NBS45733.1 CDP-alcohol phosphatidyltransferase family protein [Betaproteobacteria bacterium]
MFDRRLSLLIARPLQAMARRLHALGVGANSVTLAGCALGLGAATAIALQAFALAIALMLLSRLCDGVDGALARITQPTDAGGFLDITLDFVFYASIPLAFALADPARNGLAAAALLAAFVGTGTSFLAFAVIAAKRQLASTDYPNKSFYFLGGLTEAGETLGFFIAMCVWPQHFAPLAWVFAALCVLTTVMRIGWGWRRFH